LNAASVIVAVRLILLISVCGSIVLAYLALTDTNPMRLGALAIYALVVVVPMIWLASRAHP
jgi:hypothetical protein